MADDMKLLPEQDRKFTLNLAHNILRRTACCAW